MKQAFSLRCRLAQISRKTVVFVGLICVVVVFCFEALVSRPKHFRYDHDGDGKLSLAEVQQAALPILLEMDRDRDGLISMSEVSQSGGFVGYSLASIIAARSRFHKLDTNHDGFVSIAEITDPVTMEAAFANADKNRDGFLEINEIADAPVGNFMTER